ncbi:hypothetical protein E3N88_00870 [Mikania micrantha]|uniref:Uncharacterized protein n=1 Tax=Mikania micrantha TaxID=192012 RepID=A0A5N6PZD1_9ASTR|nr:hypothetical protein E3N88_00870 [Mikania micrantha]
MGTPTEEQKSKKEDSPTGRRWRSPYRRMGGGGTGERWRRSPRQWRSLKNEIKVGRRIDGQEGGEISAGIQQRIGPEYAGPLGILQALADGTKLLFKENLLPSIAVISILLSYLVIPFGYHLVIADLSIGVFLWIAISSIAPVGLLISSTVDIVEAQSKYGFWGWNLWRQPIGFLVFLISSLAEGERLPFDLPEAEEELVAGWNFESGISTDTEITSP